MVFLNGYFLSYLILFSPFGLRLAESILSWGIATTPDSAAVYHLTPHTLLGNQTFNGTQLCWLAACISTALVVYGLLFALTFEVAWGVAWHFLARLPAVKRYVLRWALMRRAYKSRLRSRRRTRLLTEFEH